MVSKTGNNKDNTIVGSNNDDLIKGLGGNDRLRGSDGNDTIYGGDGNDLIFGDTGSDKIFGEDGNDQIVLWSGHDIIDGGKGSDLLDFYNVTKGIHIDLADGTVSFAAGKQTGIVTFNNMEGLYGSHYSDVITGDGGNNGLFSQEGNDTVHGGDGDDEINGYKGDDKLFGDDGNDTFVMAPGKDTVDGGDGFDGLDFYYAKSGVSLALDKGSISFTQLDGKGTTKFSSIEWARGSLHDDTLTGSDIANILNGQDGDDTLSGLGGNDFVDGRDGNDILRGGAGKDTFLFDVKPDDHTNFDKVKDFAAGVDSIGFDRTVFDVAGTGRTAKFGNVNYQAIKDNEFQSSQGHVAGSQDVRVIYDESNGIVYYDSNGSKAGGLAEVADIGDHLKISADEIYVFWV